MIHEIDFLLNQYNVLQLENLNPGSTYSIAVISVSNSLWYSLPSRILTTTLLDTKLLST